MKNILITSFDLEVGGVERTLISMLNNFDYKNHNVDLMLYNHSGEFMQYLDKRVNLLPENQKYATIRKPIVNVFKQGFINLGLARVIAKYKGKKSETKDIEDVSQMQYMWKYSIKSLPKVQKEYDVAISYLWPHYCVAEKVNAKSKIAWIHTDYSMIETDINEDLKIWDKFNFIVAVSDACKNSFLNKYPSLKDKLVVIENITSPEFIRKMAQEKISEMKEKETFKVLSVARFSHAKGIDKAVSALKVVHEKGYKNIKWYVVGYGGDEQMIRDLIKENKLENDFILLGKKINPYPYMKACDLYAQPSRYEGKAVTVGEAQILAKPVMITNYLTASSQVENGVDGYIVNMNIEDIAKGIINIYKDKKFIELLKNNCQIKDYSNAKELNKLYSIFK